MNSIKVIQTFRTEADCLAYLVNLRWNADPKCPYCRHKRVSPKKETNRRPRLQCHGCHKSFSPTVNTIMHASRVPLVKWFIAIALMTEAKKGISSRQLSRHLDLPVKTAYALAQKIRKGMLGGVSPMLKGIVEIDEAYLGGKARIPAKPNKRGRGTNKQMVVGLVERGGRVVVSVPENNKYTHKEVRDLVLENVDVSKAKVYTDDYKVYSRLGKLLPHASVNHSAKEYVRGKAHTNTIEGFWASVKRAWYGTHHHYSNAYLPLYVNECAYKYNNRDNENLFQDTIKLMAGE